MMIKMITKELIKLEQILRVSLAKERVQINSFNSERSIPLCSNFSNEEMIYDVIYEEICNS